MDTGFSLKFHLYFIFTAYLIISFFYTTTFVIFKNQKILILHSQRNEILPLLKWTLIQKESVIDPLTSVISEYIPFNQKIVNETVIWALD